MPSQRETDLAAIESLTFPAGWEFGQVHEQRRYERTWWKRIERNGKPDLVGIFLSAQLRGGIEVQGYGVTIRCCAEDVQDAVDHVLKWPAREVRLKCDRCGVVAYGKLDTVLTHSFHDDQPCGGTFHRETR